MTVQILTTPMLTIGSLKVSSHFKKTAYQIPANSKGNNDQSTRKTKSGEHGEYGKTPSTGRPPQKSRVGLSRHLLKDPRLIFMCRSDPKKHSFLFLPGEIRNRVYSYLFDDQVLRLDYKLRHAQPEQPRVMPLGYNRNLLLTCHFIEKEVDELIFQKSTFLFYSEQAVMKFVSKVPDVHLARIQTLVLRIRLSDNPDMLRWFKLIEKVVLKSFNGLQYVSVVILRGTMDPDQAACERILDWTLERLGGIKKGMVMSRFIASSFPG